MKPVLSPRELAQAIGVSESSLKRWADDGLIRVARTAGGHRRIPISEAIRFIRQSRCTLVRPDMLGLSDVAQTRKDAASGTDDDDLLFSYLSRGQAPQARGLIMSLYLRGLSVAEICDGPLRQAMARLGSLWRHDPAGIFVEHRATDICIQAVQQLRSVLEMPETGPVALGGAPPGDTYLLPSLAVAITLASEGWQTVNLGPETPLETIATAAEHHRARLAWLSFTVAEPARTLRQEVLELARRLAPTGTRLALGGQSHDDLDIASNANVFVGRSLGELSAFSKGLALGTDANDASRSGH
jgi:excisionase family DNA binding protein